MSRSKRSVSASVFFLLLSIPTAANDQPRQSYALHLEARPSAAFPFLDKLGRVQIAVYPEGVRADSMWLDGFVKSGERTVRLENPALRLYADSNLDNLREIFLSLSPKGESLTLGELPVAHTGRKGTFKKLPVECYRISLGKRAWVDVWTTSSLQPSRPFQLLQAQLLSAISPDLARAAERIPGTTVQVVVNTKRFPETILLTTREVYFSSAGHEDALQTGRFFLRAPSPDRLLK